MWIGRLMRRPYYGPSFGYHKKIADTDRAFSCWLMAQHSAAVKMHDITDALFRYQSVAWIKII
jgi:hypothetical protein